MNVFKTYLTRLAFTVLLLLAAIILFNVLVDPFELIGTPKHKGFNELKPELQKHVRMVKAHQIRIRKPEVIVMGSSRAELGLDPEHPYLMQSNSEAYNLALSSANIYEVLRYLQHAHTVKPLKQVVIGLDFFMFNVNKTNEPDFDETRLAPDQVGWFRDITNSLLSYDGLTSSLTTLAQQNKPITTQYLPNGFKDDSHHWRAIQKKGGHRRATINNESYTLRALDGFIFFKLRNEDPNSSTYKHFKQILIFCKSNNIDLRLFISPEHARKLILVNAIGLWQAYEDWKLALTQLTERYAPSYSLWDFTGFNEITTEPFPALDDDQTQMEWFWESSHYKKETGDIILNKILPHNGTSNLRHPDFGIKLNLQTIHRKLEQDRTQRSAYIERNPDIIVEIAKMIADTSSARKRLINQNKHLEPIDYFRQDSPHN